MATPRRLILRDLVLFQIKLLLDGLKDLVLVQLAIFAALLDVVLGGSRRGAIFYGFMRASERFDLWLNLYSAASRARTTPGGLIEERPRGVDSLLCTVERMITAVMQALAAILRPPRRSRTPAEEPRGAAPLSASVPPAARPARPAP